MWWLFRHLRFVLFTSTMEFVTANNQCRAEVNVQGMALKRSVFKRWYVCTCHLDILEMDATAQVLDAFLL